MRARLETDVRIHRRLSTGTTFYSSHVLDADGTELMRCIVEHRLEESAWRCAERMLRNAKRARRLGSLSQLCTRPTV